MTHERHRRKEPTKVPEKTKDIQKTEAKKAASSLRVMKKLSKCCPSTLTQPPIAAWNELSFAGKCLYVFALLAFAGVSLPIIYRCYIGLTYSMDAQIQQNTQSRNILSNAEIKAFRTSGTIEKKVQYSFQTEEMLKDPLTPQPEKTQLKKARQTLVRVLETETTLAVTEAVVRQEDFSIKLGYINEIRVPSPDKKSQGLFPKGVVEGLFYQFNNTVFINMRSILFNDQEAASDKIRKTLRNEIHHARLLAFNREKKCSAYQGSLTYPYCGKNLAFDHSLADKLAFAIADGRSAIEEFYELWLSDSTDPRIQDLVKIISEHYYPQSQFWSLSSKEFEEYKASKFKKNASPNFDYEANLSDAKELTTHIKVVGTDEKEERVLLRLTYGINRELKSLIQAFWADWKQIEANIDTNLAYNNKPIESKISELASFIDELHPAMKSAFFPYFCEYFSDYFNIDNYCPETHRFKF